jgi:uncharacterized protein YndB with AHSA1/START domain
MVDHDQAILDAVEREILVAVRPHQAWRWWIEPSLVVRWMGNEAVIDPVPGGVYRIVYGNGAVMRGSLVSLDPPRRLVYTWGWEDPAEVVRPGDSTVEVTFTPEHDGTRIRVRHTGLPVPERAGHDEGWAYFLGRLVEVARR